MGASNFWGTDGQYKYLHRWIKNQSGRPQYCEMSDTTCKGSFEWANKSGEYLKDVADWIRLCRSHHRRYDDSASTHAVLQPKTHCKNGHEFTNENTRVVNTGRGRKAKRCLTCRTEYLHQQYITQKELSCV